MFDSMISRTADFLFAFCAGEHEKVIKWLVSLGCEVVHIDESGGVPCTWTIQGIAGVRSALCASLGPLDQVPVFGFLLAGAYWPHVYGGLGEEVGRRLKKPKVDAIKAEKEAEKKKLQEIISAIPPDIPQPERLR